MKIINFIKKEWIGLTSSIGLIIYLAAIYTKLPDSIPIHYNYEGAIDGYGSKSILWIIALIPLLTFIGMFFSRKLDPKRENYEKFDESYRIIRNVLTLFLALLMLITMLIPAGYDINIPLAITSVLSLLFIVLGNYLLTVKQNYFLGIRTPWTLASDNVWRKTHRLAGYEFIILGFVSIAGAFFEYPIILIVGILFITLHLYIYSYLEFKKEKNTINKNNK